MKPEILQAIRDGMWMVVNAGGTARVAQIPGKDVCGKTGTAQVISNKGRAAAGMQRKDLRDNGWFVFFAPRDNPRIAGVVFAEHGEHGTAGALVAKHVMATFFAKEDKQPLPVFRAPNAPPEAAPDAPQPEPDARPGTPVAAMRPPGVPPAEPAR
jgi:penicillin-binding protein 2